MADYQDRLDNFSIEFLKRDGDLQDRSIHRRHLVLDAIASGVFASGYFDAIKIDGPTTPGYVLTADANGWGTWQANGGGTTESVRGTFTDDDLSAGELTITHNLGLTSPYGLIVVIFDSNFKQIIPDEFLGSINSIACDLSSYGSISGVWQYIYVN